MTSSRRFLYKSVASVADQAVLSLLNLLVGLTLIRLASKEAYGLYTLLFSASLLSTALLDALISSALGTLAPKLTDADRTALIARVARLYWATALGGACLWGLAAGVGAQSTVLTGLSENPYHVGLSFAALMACLSAREFCRTAFFTQSNPASVLRLDAAYFAWTVGAAAVYVYLAPSVTVTGTLQVLTLANALSAIHACWYWWQKGRSASQSEILADIPALWRLSRWALAGAVIGWLGNNAYLYFAGIYISITASADLNSARLLLVPAALLTTAWARVGRPAAGRFLAHNDPAGMERLGWKSVAALIAVMAAFSAVLMLSLPWLQTHVLGEKYQEASLLAPLWAVYFMVNAARTVGTTFLMSYGWFRTLFWQGAVSLTLLLISWGVLMPQFGIFGALGGMILVEGIELLTNVIVLLPRAKREHLQQASAVATQKAHSGQQVSS